MGIIRTEMNAKIFIWLMLLHLLHMISAEMDTIAANQYLRDGETIISRDEKFELGFFSPGNSKNRYLGIWYYKISPQTVVWVANREKPLNDTVSLFMVSSRGNLMLLNGGKKVIWSSNSSVSVDNIIPVAQLLDTGNFIVRNESDSDSEINRLSFIWQSFDYPCDTTLPGMKFGKDFVTGRESLLTSWKSLNDPSEGLYVSWIDTNGYPQILHRRGSVVQRRYGPWNGLWFGGFPSRIQNPIYKYEFVFNQKEAYIKTELINASFRSRIYLSPEGNEVRLNWIDPNEGWVPYLATTVDICARYGLCGPYGICNIYNFPVCSCLDGFEPLYPEEWNIGNWSSGCQRKKPLRCMNGDGFRRISGVKLPDTRQSWYNVSMNLAECKIACKRDCSCTAYSNLDITSGGSGCLLWFGNLMDIRDMEANQDLYVRIAMTDSTGRTIFHPGFTRKIQVLTIVMSILAVLIGLSIAVYVFSMKKRRYYMNVRGRRVDSIGKHYSDVEKEGLELSFISLSIITKATNNFSIDNKLGQGGFGPVYKGVLETGQEIAVKQLSRTSEQGYEEFYNEVLCVAKLQHRNLVKLLGYCMDGVERILIYEYMSNKSLDLFLFDAMRNKEMIVGLVYSMQEEWQWGLEMENEYSDESKSCILEWPRRFCIINGIARGMLYLHQDSRLRIIHRDLKAANILLDHDMNPKISDFGLAREFDGNQITANTKKVVGTYGYISPEYALHGRYSVKSDVFSFGVMLLEIVSGKKNREFSHEDLNDNLLGHAWRLYTEGKCLDLMSPSIRGKCVISEVKRSIHVGLLCVQNHAHDRPTMSSVVMMLGSDGSLPPPKQPAFFAGEGPSVLNKFSGVDEATITLLEPR